MSIQTNGNANSGGRIKTKKQTQNGITKQTLNNSLDSYSLTHSLTQCLAMQFRFTTKNKAVANKSMPTMTAQYAKISGSLLMV